MFGLGNGGHSKGGRDSGRNAYGPGFATGFIRCKVPLRFSQDSKTKDKEKGAWKSAALTNRRFWSYRFAGSDFWAFE